MEEVYEEVKRSKLRLRREFYDFIACKKDFENNCPMTRPSMISPVSSIHKPKQSRQPYKAILVGFHINPQR